jgi:hypothetical protein
VYILLQCIHYSSCITIQAITTPKSLKVQGKEGIFYVQSETKIGKWYRIDVYKGECECMDSIKRYEVCKHIFQNYSREVIQLMVRHFSRQHQKRGEPKVCNNIRCKVYHRMFSPFTRMVLNLWICSDECEKQEAFQNVLGYGVK